MKRLKLSLTKKINHSYEICIGNGIMDRAATVIAKSTPARRYVVIADATVAALYGEKIMTMLKEVGLAADLIDFPAGEGSKTPETVISIARRLVELGADRETALIALGGGVTGDIVGFAASMYMRSIPYIQIPTTLLAQVDSSVGGKTGIDLPEGKNLLGAFYQPRFVFIDLEFLRSLSLSEIKNGLAEIVKYGIIDDADLFSLLEREGERLVKGDLELLQSVVEQSCKIKKGIVEIDEQDRGMRRILNFGHTLGHALEAQSAYTMSHGSAVSLGMIAASRISEKKGHLGAGERQRIERLIHSLGLPTVIPDTMDTEGIMRYMQNDKKRQNNELHFVLLKRIGMPFINGSIDEQTVKDVIEGLRV